LHRRKIALSKEGKMLIRQDIWALEDEQPWNPSTQAYALAIEDLRSRAASDPTSWTYQAAVHAVHAGQQGDQYRDQCQHGSWFFLPWHRMYLYFFERIIRASIQGHPDIAPDVKASWALPYWNYGRGGAYLSLPPCFREPLWNGKPNPLYTPSRAPSINGGARIPPQAASWTIARLKQVFSASQPGQSAGFGGPVTGFNHNPSGVYGALEQTPHNDVHGLVGGNSGWMSAFDTAPLDPIFWLHHANLDRLWSVWLTLPNRVDPTDAAWLNFVFQFHDERGAANHMKAADVLDTSVLGYTYEVQPAHQAIAAEPAPHAEQLIAAGIEPEEAVASDTVPPGPPPENPPELIGAADQPLQLQGESATVQIQLSAPASPAVVGRPESDQRMYLIVDGISGERNPGISYAVYINAGTVGEPVADSYVGNLSFFGIERVGDLSQDHASHGLRHAFNITSAVTAQRSDNRWNPHELAVMFTPLRVTNADGSAASETVNDVVTVGRISVFVQ
jgi:tyrosinase